MAQPAGVDHSERLIKFLTHAVHVQFRGAGKRNARFPIAQRLDTAFYQRMQINSDRQTLGARRNDKIYKLILKKISRVTISNFFRDRRMERGMIASLAAG